MGQSGVCRSCCSSSRHSHFHDRLQCLLPSKVPTPLSRQKANSHNAEHLLFFLKQLELQGNSSHDRDGHALFSWVSPLGSKSLIDFVPFPRSLGSCAATVGHVKGVKVEGEVDHFPVAVDLCWAGVAVKGGHHIRWDKEKMRTEDGVAFLRNLFTTAPKVD